MTPQTCCYLDYYQDADWFHEPSGWIGTVTLRTSYALEPIPPGLAAEHRSSDGNVLAYELYARSRQAPAPSWRPAARSTVGARHSR